MKPANYGPIYCALYSSLAEIAREHGYALAVHGSIATDFDLIAIRENNSRGVSDMISYMQKLQKPCYILDIHS